MKIKSSKHDQESFKKATYTLYHGLAVTVTRNKHMCLLSRDGNVTYISRDNVAKKIKQRRKELAIQAMYKQA